MKRIPLFWIALPAVMLWFAGALWAAAAGGAPSAKVSKGRPNILFAIADDWGWPHAGALGDRVVKTPTFDRIAREGMLFPHAYISSPSCTPSRNAILTGQYHWRLGTGASLYGSLPQDLDTYPHLLEDAGYATGSWRKSWGPGKLDGKWATRHPAGKVYQNGIAEFLKTVPEGKPWCFWLGASDPHRGYKLHSGAESGIPLDEIELFPFFPDSAEVRGDVADYYFEVQRFDGDVGVALALLEEKGMLENTIVVMTGDHGMPFPRCKSNLYDCGARVPLAVMWPAAQKAKGRVIEDFVSTTDLGPTFLEAAGVTVPEAMTGRSLVPTVVGKRAGRVEKRERSFVLTGKERHVPSQEAPQGGGYPTRAIRTHDFLYIRNYKPDRWPNGTPHHERAFIPGAWYADTDNGPTKSYIIENREKDDAHRRAYALCFGMRPGEELFDLSKDPDQLKNVADDPEYASILKGLAGKLDENLKATEDPRAFGKGDAWDTQPYLGGAPKFPGSGKKVSGKVKGKK